MLLGLGDFRFSVPTLSVEEMEIKLGSRVATQPVIGAEPVTHLLGPQETTLSFSSTFFPLHMNPGGERMMDALEAAARLQPALPLMALIGLLSGRPLGRWIITDISKRSTKFAPNGRAQEIEVSIDMTRYANQSGGATLGIF